MNFQEVLTKIDTALNIKHVTLKSEAEAETYVREQYELAKAESEEDDKEAGAKKAKKRLKALKSVVAMLAKASWDGQSNAITIPVYEGGVEDTTSKSELSETEQRTPPPGNTGTQGPGAPIGGAGGAQGFGDAKSTGGGGQGGTPPVTGTGADGNSFAASGGAQSFAKNMEALSKTLGALEGKPAPQQTTPVNKGDQPTPYAWPRDAANKDYLREGVTKKVEWGKDTEKSL